jgi:hypothetical protein
MNTTEENDHIRQSLKKTMPDDLPTAVANRMANRLAAFCERVDAESVNRISLWSGEFNVRQRIAAFGGIGVAAVLGFLLLWGVIAAKPLSAMEKMAENIRKARSYKATVVLENAFVSESGKPQVAKSHKSTGAAYWLAPRSFRADVQSSGNSFVLISPAGKSGISIDHIHRTFTRSPVHAGAVSPLAAALEKLGDFVGQADRELGPKEIDGKKAWGYQIDMRKIEPDRYPGVVEFWLDADSWPISVRVDEKRLGMLSSQVSRFEWNIDLDPRLFDTTPPKGYKDVTPKIPALEGLVREIGKALKVYADMSGGSYPRHKRLYADVICDELYKMIGIESPPTPAQRNDEKYKTVEGARLGFIQISVAQDWNTDFAYHGKTVGPKDKDKVLLRWKLDDGRYEVIYGDLRAETVTAERLRALEGK